MDMEKLTAAIKAKIDCQVVRTGDEEEQEYTLTFKLEDRKQDLVIYPVEEEGKEYVRMISFIAKRQEFSANKLISFLELNVSLRHGSFGLYQGQVVLTESADYKNDGDLDLIVEKIQFLMKMADRFEQSLVGLDRK